MLYNILNPAPTLQEKMGWGKEPFPDNKRYPGSHFNNFLPFPLFPDLSSRGVSQEVWDLRILKMSMLESEVWSHFHEWWVLLVIYGLLQLKPPAMCYKADGDHEDLFDQEDLVNIWSDWKIQIK